MADLEDTRLARHYVLGSLSAEDRDKVERRFLFDADFEETVILEEIDLLDALSAGSLTADEERAIRHWAREHEHARHRLELAGAFHHVTQSETLGPLAGKERKGIHGVRPLRLNTMRTPRFSSLSIAGLAFVCCVLALASLWLMDSNRSLKARLQTMQSAQVPAQPSAPIATSPAPPQLTTPSTADSTAPKVKQATPAAQTLSAPPATPHPESVLTVLLVAEEGRGSTGVAEVVLQPRTKAVKLQLIAQSELPEGGYVASVTGPDGGPFYGPDRLHSQRVHQHNLVTLHLPSESMTPGVYHVQLTQQTSTNSPPALEYAFQIKEP